MYRIPILLFITGNHAFFVQLTPPTRKKKIEEEAAVHSLVL